MIQKHAIPILEFDDNPQAVIMPNHEAWIYSYQRSASMHFWKKRLTAMLRK